jgi:hypothetical protein
MSLKSHLKKFVPQAIIKLRTKYVLKKLEKRFEGKSTKDVFATIYKDQLWGDVNSPKTFDSGSGSHDSTIVDKYVESIEKYFASKQIVSIVDLGCGDFNVGIRLRPLFANYIACDIVPELIAHHQRHLSHLKVDFRQLDLSKDELPQGEVLFVRQVLQHLNNDLILKFVQKLKNSSYKQLVLTEHIPSGNFVPNLDKPVGSGIRLGRGKEDSGVVLTAAPFNFSPKKEEVICEVPQMNGVIRTIVYTL